jgi:hypothetical protein
MWSPLLAPLTGDVSAGLLAGRVRVGEEIAKVGSLGKTAALCGVHFDPSSEVQAEGDLDCARGEEVANCAAYP